MSTWERLGAVNAEPFLDARLQLHWAAQIAAAPGKQLLPPQPDGSEQSFQWDAAAGALTQGTVTAPRPFRSALRPAALSLALLDEGGSALAELPLAGRTLDAGYAWLTKELETLLGRSLARPLDRLCSADGLPAHPVETGAPFSGIPPEAYVEVARWYANADRLLRAVQTANPEASPVRCWPHHFDLATLLTLDPGMDAESARSIGVGLSPGDAGDIGRPEPYFYVTPWPYPKSPALPSLAGGGSWNTEGWLGAVLEARAFVGGADQEGQVRDFLESAIAAARRLIDTA
ncbi:MAG TPA: hypothetical protein VFE33_15580 [Thermoanaerobaculia bacterium]|nr:hypothetical protein [Thermoanaerobaculia bacterium]